MTERSPDHGPTLTRRQLLAHGGRAALALPLLGVPVLLASCGRPGDAPLARRSFAPLAPLTPFATAATPGRTRAGEWTAADGDALRALGDGGWTEFAAPFGFDALGAHWANEGDPHLEISVSADGTTWTEPQTMHLDGHGPAPGTVPDRAMGDRRFAELLHVWQARFVRYRAVDGSGETVPAPDDLRFVYIDASDGPAAADLEGQVETFEATLPKVVARAGWGCDEKLRFDKRGKEIWEVERYTTEKIVIHHTDTSNEQDPLQAIRSIYYYHAVTRGWGDIGYNFLVDRNGVVYEGRFGGEHVVAGHALSYNYGSVGIGVIGSFTTTAYSPATEAAVAQLAAYQGRFLDPLGRYFFIDKMLPNILGHRDCLSTSCPGDALYPRLPTIRQAVAGILGATPTMNIAITGIAAKGTTAVAQTPFSVRVTVKNTGTAVIPSYYDAGLTYFEGDTFDSKDEPRVEGRFRIVAEVEGASPPAVGALAVSPTPGTDGPRPSATPTRGTATPVASPTPKPPPKPEPNPYRWGFGRSLNPGETVEVNCRIAFRTPGTKRLRFGLIQEKIAYKQQGLAGPTIQVIGNPVDPLAGPPAGAAADLIYFPESRHTLGGAFRRYWEKFGGLAQFGYPLTEEFLELNEVDDREYVVQYFERARFEHHPEHAGGDYEVLLGLVGRLFHAVDKPAAPITAPTHVYFPQTGHNLGNAFREYWEAYGGLFVYGYPLTEEIAERSRIDGKEYTVQYFERARFEYHPENTGKSRVLLGHLGRQMLQDRGWLK